MCREVCRVGVGTGVDGGAHGARATLSAPIWTNPGHPERRIPVHTQPHAVGSTWSSFMAARAIFVPESGSAGAPFFTSGPGGTASNPNKTPLHMYRWIDTVVLYVWCTGFAHAPAEREELSPGEVGKGVEFSVKSGTLLIARRNVFSS